MCDFSPPRGADLDVLERARGIDADYICVAYNPGKAVRVDSAMLASGIKHRAGKDVVFNLGTRDMNKLALQSHLLGAQMMGLENVIVVKGDDFVEKDLSRVKAVSDFSPTGLVRSMGDMNRGSDFREAKLRAPTDLCIGASIDLGRGIKAEAALTHRKASAGAQFFITQPVFSASEITAFREAYRAASGEELAQPVFFGLQVMVKDGVIFSGVPKAFRDDLDKGRSGVEIALQVLQEFLNFGINTIYLVPPILRGGARDYEAAQSVLEGIRGR